MEVRIKVIERLGFFGMIIWDELDGLFGMMNTFVKVLHITQPVTPHSKGTSKINVERGFIWMVIWAEFDGTFEMMNRVIDIGPITSKLFIAASKAASKNIVE